MARGERQITEHIIYEKKIVYLKMTLFQLKIFTCKIPLRYEYLRRFLGVLGARFAFLVPFSAEKQRQSQK